jgi:hypothetical protein
MQLIFFNKNQKQYCDNFLQNCGFTQKQKEDYFSLGNFEELEELLYFKWQEKDIKKLIDRNIKIEVYLGSYDKIINSQKALEFFKNCGCEVYYIKK